MDEQRLTAVAQGVVMCRYGLPRGAALRLLHAMADESGTGVADVAVGLIEEHEQAVQATEPSAARIASEA